MSLSYMCAENNERYRIIIFKIQKILSITERKADVKNMIIDLRIAKMRL